MEEVSNTVQETTEKYWGGIYLIRQENDIKW